MRKEISSIAGWVAIIGSCLVLVVNVYTVVTVAGTRAAKLESQKYLNSLNRGLRVQQINSQLINALANVSARTQDAEIRSVLASEGVTFSVNDGSSGTDE